MAKKSRFSKRIKFIGFVEGYQKEILYKNADLLVIPSRSEAMSLVVLEAALQARGRELHTARRFDCRVRRRVPVLHDDQATQPALRARGVCQGDAPQLHDHTRGPAGSAARRRRRARAR